MTRVWLIALCFLWPTMARAQTITPSPQSIIAQGSTCATAGACASWNIGAFASVTMQITGTFSATLTFEATADGQTWFALAPVKLSDGSSSTTTTATGQYALTNTGLQGFRARAGSFSSGGANITLTRGTASARLTTGSSFSPVISNVFCLDQTNQDLYWARIGTNNAGWYSGATNCASGTLRFDYNGTRVNFAVPLQQTATSLGTTSTDGLLLQNTTPATIGTTVQISQRIRQCGSGYNSSSGLSETDCYFPEVLPATAAGSTSALWKLGATLNGGAALYPLTVNSNGDTTSTGRGIFNAYTVSATGYYEFAASSTIKAPTDGQFNLLNQAQTSGAGLNVSTDGALSIRNRAQNADGVLKAGTVNATAAYQLNGTAGVGFAFLATTKPANQTGNATATLKMNGLGAAAAPCTITPLSTGRVTFNINGNVTNSIILDGAQLILVYGTGTAPANAAAATGTVISATQTPAVPVAAQNQGFSITGSATGLSLVATWFDLQISDVTGGTASVTNITCSAFES